MWFNGFFGNMRSYRTSIYIHEKQRQIYIEKNTGALSYSFFDKENQVTSNNTIGE